ncbi:MAG: anti-sigma factor [Polyangia bacterium]
MTCAEFKELVGAYALGALSPEECAACDAHLSSTTTHEDCWHALSDANAAAALVAMSVPAVTPPPAVWAAIERRLDRAAAPAPRRRSTEWVAWTIGVAALVLVFFIARDRDRLNDQVKLASAASQRVQQERASCATDLEHARADADTQHQALELLSRRGTKLIALAPQPSDDTTRVASVMFNPESQRAFLIGHGLAAPTGKDYQLWIIRGDQKIPAGLLHGDAAGGAIVAAIDPKLLGTAPDAIAVTLEATGGAPQPLGPIVLVGKI